MNDLKPFVCQQCGAPINRQTMTCEYCGTQYRRERDEVMVHYTVQRPGVHVLKVQTAVPDDLAAHNPEAATEYAMRKLRDHLAESLLAYMKLDVEKDTFRYAQIIRGEIRVVDPMFDH